jgi:Cys-rich protein (TIGR01571 family)
MSGYDRLNEPQVGGQPAYNPNAYQQQAPMGVPVQQAYAPQYVQPQQNYAGPPQQYAAAPYGGQPVAYIVPVAGGATMGQPGHLQRGVWSDGICDCFDSWSICLLAWCIIPIRWAQTMERVQFMTFMNALIVYGLPWLIFYICYIVEAATAIVYLSIPAVICTIIQIVLGIQYRAKLREQYQIQGSGCEDCLLHTFCRCCAVAQEARHVDRDYAIPL